MKNNRVTNKTVIDIFNCCKLSRDFLEGKAIFEVNTTTQECMIVDNQEKFDDALENFMKSKDAEGLSQQFAIMMIRKVLLECREYDDSDYHVRSEGFIKIINGFEVIDHKVIKTIYGVNIDKSVEPIKFKNLTIYDISRHKEQLHSLFMPKMGMKSSFYKDHDHIAIECLVKAKDPWKALELSNEIFNRFDLMLAFFLNENYTNYSMGVLRVNFKPHQNAMINSKHVNMLGDEINITFRYDFDISTLKSLLPKKYSKYYEDLIKIALTPLNLFDKKIASAIEWLAESNMDTNKASSYLKAVIALEALLKLDEKGVITASIMSSIAEQCAFLHANTIDERIEVERQVKNFYAERSKIAHTGTNSVSPKKLRAVREFVMLTILRLVALTVLLNLKSPDEFQSILRKKKYDGGSLHCKL